MSKNSRELLLIALRYERLDLVKWLINEKSYIPKECHSRECFESRKINLVISDSIEKLKKLNIILDWVTGKNSVKNLFEPLFNNSGCPGA